jgi:hypothetical protein
VLAGAPNGCTEAIMLAHGFTVETLGRLLLEGLATATPGTMQAGGRQVAVTWLASGGYVVVGGGEDEAGD